MGCYDMIVGNFVCPYCNNESHNIFLKSDDHFEFLESYKSTSNFDDWDFCAVIKCKSCDKTFEFEQ